MNTLLFQINIFQTLNCQALNSLCLCSSCIFVLQSKVTEFSAILKQQQNDNTSRLVYAKKRPGTRAVTSPLLSDHIKDKIPKYAYDLQQRNVSVLHNKAIEPVKGHVTRFSMCIKIENTVD